LTKGDEGGLDSFFKRAKVIPKLQLRVFHHDAGDDVGGLISPVRRIAEVAINLTHLEHVDRIRSLEEIS
jgi:hypothetical protein